MGNRYVRGIVSHKLVRKILDCKKVFIFAERKQIGIKLKK